MKINIKKLPKSIEELEKIIFSQQQEIEKQKQEITSYKRQYVRLLEDFKLKKSRRFSVSTEKNILQSDLFDEPGIELIDELKDQLDDTVDVKSYTRKKHPVRRLIPKDIPREIIIHDISEAEKQCWRSNPLYVIQLGISK